MTSKPRSDVRKHAAIVRALIDEVDLLLPYANADEPGLTEHLVEELASLGCRVLETAADFARILESREAPIESGVHARADRPTMPAPSDVRRQLTSVIGQQR